MNNPFFQKSDFQLCSIAVPKGYPQSLTHSGVYRYGNKLYLTCSPYPQGSHAKYVNLLRVALYKISCGKLIDIYSDEKYENPLLYSADIRDLPVKKFSLMHERALMETPVPYYGLPSFNSDPDLYIENGELFILNRSFFRKYDSVKNETAIQRIYLIRGVDDEGRFKMTSTVLFREFDNPDYASPCLTKYNGKYYFFFLHTRSAIDGKTYYGLFYYVAPTIEELAKEQRMYKINMQPSKYLPWHLSVFEFKGNLYSIIACPEKGNPHKIIQRIAKLDIENGQMYISETPLTDYNSYRSSAYVDDYGDLNLYNATLHEKIKGSKSVDGRDIIVAKMPFSVILADFSKNSP